MGEDFEEHAWGCKRGKGGTISPFPSRLSDHLHEIPELARRQDASGGGVAIGGPVRSELDGGGVAGVFGFGEEEDAFFFEALVGVFEGFFVDGFEVGEVALVEERLAELVPWMLVMSMFVPAFMVLTSWALSCV